MSMMPEEGGDLLPAGLKSLQVSSPTSASGGYVDGFEQHEFLTGNFAVGSNPNASGSAAGMWQPLIIGGLILAGLLILGRK